MPISDLFSKRQKRSRGEFPDVFQYTNLPPTFRVQVVHILRDALGEPKMGSRADNTLLFTIFKGIHNTLCREYGLFSLADEDMNEEYDDTVYNFFLNCNDIERALDVIEESFKVINFVAREEFYQSHVGPTMKPDEAIDELNARFLEQGIGFRFESNQIIRVDSEFVHSEVIKPALQVLKDKRYEGANAEFLTAHEHYRHGRYKDCLNECLKAFESTMKSICENRQWQYSESDTAKTLLDICFQKGLIPNYLQTHFTSLRSGLESGVPTVRNKVSGHGQGTQQTDVPPYLASYLLNLTATSILLLTNAESELP